MFALSRKKKCIFVREIPKISFINYGIVNVCFILKKNVHRQLQLSELWTNRTV